MRIVSVGNDANAHPVLAWVLPVNLAGCGNEGQSSWRRADHPSVPGGGEGDHGRPGLIGFESW